MYHCLIFTVYRFIYMASIDLKDNIAVTTVTHSKISLEELQHVFC
uniref:Uncharacterized protein n=1 Tax=Triticum urartu TaxID=4572 RepID=A0A8R7PVF2_TRIUA